MDFKGFSFPSFSCCIPWKSGEPPQELRGKRENPTGFKGESWEEQGGFFPLKSAKKQQGLTGKVRKRDLTEMGFFSNFSPSIPPRFSTFCP